MVPTATVDALAKYELNERCSQFSYNYTVLLPLLPW